jgi:hypothetical protein
MREDLLRDVKEALREAGEFVTFTSPAGTGTANVRCSPQPLTLTDAEPYLSENGYNANESLAADMVCTGDTSVTEGWTCSFDGFTWTVINAGGPRYRGSSPTKHIIVARMKNNSAGF